MFYITGTQHHDQVLIVNTFFNAEVAFVDNGDCKGIYFSFCGKEVFPIHFWSPKLTMLNRKMTRVGDTPSLRFLSLFFGDFAAFDYEKCTFVTMGNLPSSKISIKFMWIASNIHFNTLLIAHFLIEIHVSHTKLEWGPFFSISTNQLEGWKNVKVIVASIFL